MDDPAPPPHPRHGLQMAGSLIVAILIVIAVIWAVTARLGPTSITELDAKEEAADEAADSAEEAQEEAREADADRESGRRRRGRGRN